MAHQQPLRVGIDARMLHEHPTGVGNYIFRLLAPMCLAHPESKFHLYAHGAMRFIDAPNVELFEEGKQLGPLWMNFQLPKRLKQHGIDVFWAPNGIAPTFGTMPPVVLTVHDLTYRLAATTMTPAARWNRWFFQRRSVRRATRVIAVSHATASDIASIYRRTVDAVIHPPPDDVFYRRAREAVADMLLHYRIPTRFWMFTGTLEPRKNLLNFLRAVMTGREQGLEIPVLVLAGAAGWGDTSLNDLISKGEALGFVRHLGYVPPEALACLYSGCEMLWLPSVYEGFGMPLTEAQLCGAPVVHGPHRSMQEAAVGLGVVTGVTQVEMLATMRRILRGEAPLVCRISGLGEDEAQLSSLRLWDCLVDAAGVTPGVS